MSATNLTWEAERLPFTKQNTTSSGPHEQSSKHAKSANVLSRLLSSNYNYNWKALTFLPFGVSHKKGLAIPHHLKAATSLWCYGGHVIRDGIGTEIADQYVATLELWQK